MKNSSEKNDNVKPSYLVTKVEGGKWLHAPGSDFLFAFLKETWDPALITKVTTAFEDALDVSNKIKAAVKATSGETVVDGLYLLDQPAMTKAMNTIDGMGMTRATMGNQNGNGVAVDINAKFFASVLGALGGDVTPILKYLTSQMGDMQAQTRKSNVTVDFGTVIGLVSVMPILDVVVTSFQYAYSSKQTSEEFVKWICGSATKYSYNYDFVTVNYNYRVPAEIQALHALIAQ
ncbi:hypothetical protein SAMN06298216_4193 [Spirosomataceae bacterium TFI 002]|nr:hypothetical protein SAMN06298216_4193 [Spirosomataceae bacterium TFI 002]